jgi:hypothetical protein
LECANDELKVVWDFYQGFLEKFIIIVIIFFGYFKEKALKNFELS